MSTTSSTSRLYPGHENEFIDLETTSSQCKSSRDDPATPGFVQAETRNVSRGKSVYSNDMDARVDGLRAWGVIYSSRAPHSSLG